MILNANNTHLHTYIGSLKVDEVKQIERDAAELACGNKKNQAARECAYGA
jgi:hypothetical protein